MKILTIDSIRCAAIANRTDLPYGTYLRAARLPLHEMAQRPAKLVRAVRARMQKKSISFKTRELRRRIYLSALSYLHYDLSIYLKIG
jgi:hypothetical protein